MSPLVFFCAMFFAFAGIVEATVIRLEVVVGQTVVLPCTLDGTNGTQVFWYSTVLSDYLTYHREVKRTVPVDMASRLAITGQGTNYDLRISEVSTTDAGEFRCSIYTTTVNRKIMHVVNVNYQLVVNVPPGHEYPMCDVHSNGGTRSVGDFVTISCASHGGQPLAQLTWYRGDQPISVMTTQYVTGHVITFNKTLDEFDNGVSYVCESRSPAYSQPMLCSVTPLSIPPVVIMETLHDRVYEKDHVTYNCRGTGMPSVSYRWLMNGTEVTGYSQRLVVGRDGSELQVLGVDPFDNGTTITCEVSTPAGLTSSYTRTMIVMSRSSVTCNQGNDEGNSSIFTKGQSKLAILPLLVAFLGGVGLTLLVVLVVVFECKRRNKRLIMKAKQKNLGSRFWTTKNEGVIPPPDPLPGINIFVKESNYDTNDQNSQPPSLPPRGPTGMSQKNQYFDMNSGTFQKHLLSATLPAVGSKNDYQMRCVTHTPPLGYENVEKGSTTDVSELTQDDMCDSYRPPIPTPEDRPPMSPIYMEPKTHEQPQQPVQVDDAVDVALRRGYDAVPPGKRDHVRVTRNHRRRDGWERPEYTEIDGLAHSPVRNTYETSIISNFEL